MKFNKWTMGLAAVGVVSLASAARADEKMSQVQTALSNTTLSGYVDTSAMWNLGSQNGGTIPAYTQGAGVKGDGFNVDAFDLALDKPMDEGQWASGYHAELLLGPNWVGGSSYPIRQAYLTLRTPVANSGIDWKFGTMDAPIGYESSSDPLNPNFTRSYGYQLEPTTITGLLGTYKVTDMISVTAGIANAGTTGNALNGSPNVNSGATRETQKAYIGEIALTAPDSWGWAKGATLEGTVIQSDKGSAAAGGGGATWLYVGATVPTPADALKVGAAFDYLDMHNGANSIGNQNHSDDSIWAAALYANFKCNDKLSFNARGELRDATAAHNGRNGEEFTATAQYALWANVLSRVEFRWDHNTANAFDAQAGSGNLIPTQKNAYLLALNLIYQF
jgi:hypothetical protein